MELLIPGLILVALMVYASTRIKRSAARAFDAETIDTIEFVIKKPDGFLNVIGGDPQYAFEAYSKDFGSEGAQEFRQGYAKLTIRNGGTMDHLTTSLHVAGDEIVSDISEVIGETRYRVIEAKRVEKGVELRVFFKIAERETKIYELEIAALAETPPEFMRKTEAMLDSFELK
jgi:hypothetical protein